MGALKVKDNLYWVGIQDHELRVFDVVMETQHGTSYNSYILKTDEHVVLFETVKIKFFDKFMENIREVCDPADIDYIVVNHTEPDHAGSLEKLLDYAPKAKVLASSIALTFLKDITNRPIPGVPVHDKEVLDLKEFKLNFLSVPFLHWPDSMYTYIEGLNTLVSCDSFGCHYADDRVFNDLIEGDFTPSYRYYFNMIMGPFKPHVQYALNRIKDVDFDTICPGHGPVLRTNLEYYLNLYDEWSKEPEKEKRDKPMVVIPFVSAYGYTEQLSHEIITGIKSEIDADVRLYDMVTADKTKVAGEMASADGILVGTPTINGDALPPVMDLVMNLNGILHGGKVAGAFGSYGWSGEGPDFLMSRLNLLRMNTIEPALKIKFKPDDSKRSLARNYGKKFGKKLKEEWVKLGTSEDGKTYWKCVVCGEIFEGALPPSSCSVCGAGVDAFIEYFPEVISHKKDEDMNIVIVGSGAGAVATAESIRKRNKKANINIYGREEVNPYYRPVLTKAISENIGDEEFYIESESFYKEQNINLNLGKNVSKIDPSKKEIVVDEQPVSYDKLVIATGAEAFCPPIQGAQLPEVLTLREHNDLESLKSLLKGDKKRVVVIGGGLLGLETADSLIKKGHEVTIIEASPRILPRQLDPEGAKMVESLMKKSELKIKLDVFVDEIIGEDHVKTVKTKTGEYFDCDLVVISAGIRSNTDLAKKAGLKVEHGIEVNNYMQTSDSNIYAVGDCASFNGRLDGIWETALNQGRIAGAHIAGDIQEYEPKVFGATLQAFGMKLFSLGDAGKGENQKYQQVGMKDEIENRYRKLYFKDGKLSGGILLNDMVITNSLQSGVARSITVEEAKDNKLL